MATTALFTFQDVRTHLLDWQNAPTSDQVLLRKLNRAIASAYREFLQARDWSLMWGRGRLQTQAMYNTGTIAYTQSTRTVTLTGGTFPSWANLGRISFGSPLLEYQVVSATGTTLVLSVNVNPGADVAAGTAYQLFQDVYPVPVNLAAVGTMKDSQRNVVLQYIEPNDWVAMRPYNTFAQVPRFFTIFADPSYVGTLGFALLPPPDIQYNLDYMYKRKGRQFTTYQYNTGTVTTSGTTVTGSGTSWTSKMVGCVIRFGADGVTKPTGLEGSNPYGSQRIVSSWTSATSLTIDQALDAEVSAVTHEISDPIEIEADAMYTAFLRKCELDLAPLMRRTDIPLLKQIYDDAYLQACEQDSRSVDHKPVGARYFQRVPTYWTLTNQS